MQPSLWWIVLLFVFIGHFGLHIAIYNRVNALGTRRRTTKTIVLFFFLTSLLIPTVVILSYSTTFSDLLIGRGSGSLIPYPLFLYGTACLATWVGFGIPWVVWRPILKLEWVDAPRNQRVVDVQNEVDVQLPLTLKCRYESKLPLNQIFELSIDEIELPVVGLPSALDGYKVAQLSDIHLTGEIHGDFTRYVVQTATNWKPDIMALTGDVIDNALCIDWLAAIFSPARAQDGCYFILGNHDLRVRDPQQTRDAMSAAGWTDLGSKTKRMELRGVSSLLIGNESPWFPRPKSVAHDVDFRLLLSHSPDQFAWARQHGVQLMLAGHTHGGQGRLPIAGPILSPSHHGSRYASGDFFRPPTTLHVSRGLSGTHLLRINCRPELSLITLRMSDNHSVPD